MKITSLFLLLLPTTLSCAGSHPDEYSIKIHVISSRWVVEPALDGPQALQKLTVMIGGSKKYELEAPVLNANLQAGVAVLALGDYKAKLVQNEHKSTYEFSLTYEFLFLDKKPESSQSSGSSSELWEDDRSEVNSPPARTIAKFCNFIGKRRKR